MVECALLDTDIVFNLTEQGSTIGLDLLRRYRLSHGLLIGDGLIAATAFCFDLPFVTKNRRDYRFMTGFDLRPYPRPFAGTISP